MTCIVGLLDHGDVYFGADSMVTRDESVVSLAEPKIWEASGCLWGYSGPLMVMQLLKSQWALPKVPARHSKDAYLRRVLPDSLRKFLTKEIGFQPGEDLAEVLFCFQGHLCSLILMDKVDHPVLTHAGSFWAVGAGVDFALGSLHTTEGIGMPPQDRLQLALEAATFGSTYVRPPFNFLRLSAPATESKE